MFKKFKLSYYNYYGRTFTPKYFNTFEETEKIRAALRKKGYGVEIEKIKDSSIEKIYSSPAYSIGYK